MTVNSELIKLVASDRSEDLSPSQVLAVFAGSGGDEDIVRRLMGGGVILLQGSRGTGKTMLMRVAHERLLAKTAETKSLSVFVSFSRYLATYNMNTPTQPGYHIFQSWVFAKIVTALCETAREYTENWPENIVGDVFGLAPLEEYTQRLETHYLDSQAGNPSSTAAALQVQEKDLVDFARLDRIGQRILEFLDRCSFTGVTFFFDEAAQSFAEELQPEFFQLVRHLRHHRISVKAAVYPNTTNYGKDFDIGQDAVVIPIERQVETTEGMAMFTELVEKRFSGSSLGMSMNSSPNILDFLIKMSGGNPRWFIHLANAVQVENGGTIPQPKAISVAKQFPDSTLWPYLRKLRENLPRRRNYVDAALSLSTYFLDSIRDANKNVRRGGSPVCYVAVSMHRTVPYRVHAALGILQYAGIISRRGPKKISDRDTAEMYMVHPAILVRENIVFGAEPNPSIDWLLGAFSDPPRDKFREFTRNSPRLLEFRQSEEADEVLCTKCDQPLPDNARFCPNCGETTSKISPFQELLSRPADMLEITSGVKQRVLEDGRFPTVGDLFNASDSAIDSIAWIGPSRVLLIRYAVEEFIAG